MCLGSYLVGRPAFRDLIYYLVVEVSLAHVKWVVNNIQMFCEVTDCMVQRKCLLSSAGVKEGFMEDVKLNPGPEEWEGLGYAVGEAGHFIQERAAYV